MKDNKKTVVYARTASIKQNIDLQLEAANPHLKGIQEENIVMITDYATPSSFQQKGLQNLLELVKNDQVDTLIVYQRDRLARNFYEYLEIMDLIYTHKVNVIFTGNEQPFEHDQEFGTLKEFMYQLLHESEGSHISNRIKAIRKAKQS